MEQRNPLKRLGAKRMTPTDQMFGSISTDLILRIPLEGTVGGSPFENFRIGLSDRPRAVFSWENG
jgi:hypothetical protein